MKKPRINKVKQVKYLNKSTRNRVKHTHLGTIARIVALLVALIAFAWSQSNLVLVQDLTYTSEIIPKYYDDYKIVLVSDLENTSKNIFKKIAKEKPNLVLIAGGLTDSNGQFDKSVNLLNKLGNSYETYYILDKDDLNNKENIVSNINSAVYLDNDMQTLGQIINDAKDYINEHIDEKIITKAQNGDEEYYNYLSDVINRLEEDVDRTIEVAGLNYQEGPEGLNDKIISLFSNNENNFKILLFNNYRLLDNVSKTSINIAITGGSYPNKTMNSKNTLFINGTTLFTPNGIGSKHSGRFLNYPSIISITLSSFKEPAVSPLEKLLDLLNII